jgi:hypothetical protein
LDSINSQPSKPDRIAAPSLARRESSRKEPSQFGRFGDATNPGSESGFA